MTNKDIIKKESNAASSTVKSLKDIENSTCEISSYRGRPTFTINQQTEYPFSFGLLKAKLLVKYRNELLRFVETDGKSIT